MKERFNYYNFKSNGSVTTISFKAPVLCSQIIFIKVIWSDRRAWPCCHCHSTQSKTFEIFHFQYFQWHLKVVYSIAVETVGGSILANNHPAWNMTENIQSEIGQISEILRLQPLEGWTWAFNPHSMWSFLQIPPLIRFKLVYIYLTYKVTTDLIIFQITSFSIVFCFK